MRRSDRNRETRSAPSPCAGSRSLPASLADLGIALNATVELGREPVCRLAARPETWLADAPAEDAEICTALRLAPERLALARRVATDATRLAERERRRAAAAGARLVSRWDPEYPVSLLDLELPPPALYVHGCLPTGAGVAIVGSRHADAYGLEVARLFSRRLAANGVTVISGFARGVDAAAHRAALAAVEENRTGDTAATVAVLGCGIGVDYPRGHRSLGEAIGRRGAIVSEFPIGAPPAAWQFPVRNRILAALGTATLVVQAAERSGSLITARLALELGRDVYAVPGRIFDRRSQGANALIRDGAHPVARPSDILERIDPALCHHADGDDAVPLVAPTDDPVLAALPPGEAVRPETVAERAGLETGGAGARLLELELEGRVVREPGGRYRRAL